MVDRNIDVPRTGDVRADQRTIGHRLLPVWRALTRGSGRLTPSDYGDYQSRKPRQSRYLRTAEAQASTLG